MKVKKKKMFPKRFARTCGRFLYRKLAEDVRVVDVRKALPVADYFVLATGTSERHVRSLAYDLMDEMEKRGYELLGHEGIDEGRWALLDYGDVVIHLFTRELRTFYDVEGLWADCEFFVIEEGW